MSVSFITETELPGSKVNLDTLQVIAHRYYWTSQFVSGQKILEAGCGPGLGLGYLAHHAEYIIGGDVTKDSLTFAKKHYGSSIALTCMDAHRLPFSDNCLDVVVCLAAVIYLDLPTFVAECHRVLKKDGLLIVNTPNRGIPGFRPSLLSHRYYSVPELYSILDQHHFEARIFGAFAIPHGIAGIQARLLAVVKRLVGRILRILRFYEAIKRVIHADASTLTLKEELREEMELVENISVVPLSCEVTDQQHRIVYAVAQAK